MRVTKLLALSLAGAASLAGCGTPINQALNGAASSDLVGAQSAHKHGLGFRFGEGRPMNPVQPMIFTGATLPSQVDNRSVCSPIADQGQLGSCTAFAMGRGLREYLENKEANQFAKQQPFGSLLNIPLRASSQFTTLSAMFLYYEERAVDGDTDQDGGSTISTGMSVLSNTGICPEADDPYLVDQFKNAPSAKALAGAAQFKIHSDSSLNTLQDIKATVAAGWPVVFGFMVYDNFMSIAADGVMPLPTPNNSIVGGHAVMVAGYDDARQVLIMRNSWSATWGDHGYFYMPYSYVTPANIQDIWTAQ